MGLTPLLQLEFVLSGPRPNAILDEAHIKERRIRIERLWIACQISWLRFGFSIHLITIKQYAHHFIH